MTSLLDDAMELLQAATKLEKEESTRIEAATKYYEGCYLLKRYLQRMPCTDEHVQSRQLVKEKIAHYEKLASTLLQEGGTTQPRSPYSKHCHFFDDSSVIPMDPPTISSPRYNNASENITVKAGQANTRLAHALDLDESGNKQDAIQEYMAAAELYLEAIKIADDNDSITALLKRRLASALDRVEELKHPSNKALVHEAKVRQQQKQTKGSSLTEEEIAVLKRSSLIASGVFLPWSDEDALKLATPSIYASLYKDPGGFLKLSDKQQRRFYKWARPSDIAKMTRQKPVMVMAITPYTIRQQCVTDCSFIASLCICAAFERRFQRKLVTSLIYPQDQEGNPILSPNGKYAVKLWLNGVARQVIVDDYLPVDRHGNLLCSHTNGLELWVSIIEKGYMKLCGGYDFPGSNSGVDLFSLTGWIPERIFFPKDANRVRDHETHPERAWERLYGASSYGDCLITMSTSADLDDTNDVGLVTGHAYAVLSVIQTRNGTRLLQLKNPWAYKAWKGKYSCHDIDSWRDKSLCAEVGYDPVLAAKHDDGVFWISWDDVLIYFQNIQLSWNPALFSFRTTVHGFWPNSQGPQDDTFNAGENPQYILNLSDAAIYKKATVWILLSRHVTKQEQEGTEATDFLTVHVHRNSGKREVIWFPGGKSCILTGAYSNNPHVLMRYDVTGPADKNLSLVLSQYKKSHDLGYTLSCFCTERFTLGHPTKPLPLSTEIAGEWTLSTGGGPPGSATFQCNPMFAVRVPEAGTFMQIRCTSSAKSFAINVMLVAVESYAQRVQQITSEPTLDSGDYRHGFTVTERKKVPGGLYTLIVSTFEPSQVGSFRLIIAASSKLKFERVT